MDGRELVAWNLRRLRVARGWSQDGLALESQIDRSYVGRLERKGENPTVDMLDRLAKILQVHVSELLAEPSPGDPPPSRLRAGRKAK